MRNLTDIIYDKDLRLDLVKTILRYCKTKDELDNIEKELEVKRSQLKQVVHISL